MEDPDSKREYLLLLLMSIYVPVTRNSFQMIACADKYAFDQYRCEPNSTRFRSILCIRSEWGFAGARKCTCDDPSSCPSGVPKLTSTPTSNNDHMTSRNYIQIEAVAHARLMGYHRIDKRFNMPISSKRIGLR